MDMFLVYHDRLRITMVRYSSGTFARGSEDIVAGKNRVQTRVSGLAAGLAASVGLGLPP